MAGVRLVDDHLTCVLSCGCARRTLVSRWKGRWRWLLLLWLLWPWLSLLAGLAQLRNEDEWFTSSSGEFLLSSGRSEEYGGLGRRQSTLYTDIPENPCAIEEIARSIAINGIDEQFTYKSGSKTQESRNK
uniref:Beta-amylase n=1 Tax=Oryza glumipatula TaxID=40148 RepID=A0A0D9YJN3_9ORYZ